MKAIIGFWSLLLTCLSLFITPHTHASSGSSYSSSSSDSQPNGNILLPPTHLHGRQIANKFLSQTDLINVIKWSPPTSGPAPVAYNIYRDVELTDLLAVIPADHRLIFSDHNRKEHHKYSYFLVSVDAAGNQSNAIGIIFHGPKTHVVKVKRLLAIEVTPIDPTIAKDFEIQFTATGIFSDNSKKDLTNKVTWSSSNEAVAIISNDPLIRGLATGLSAGTTEIAATFRGVTGSTTLTVTSATLVSIQVTPTNQTIPAGFQEQFTAIGIFSDDTKENLTEQVVWSSTNSAVASISNNPGSQGLASGLTPGVVQIQATHGSITGSTTLTVTAAQLLSIGVTPAIPNLSVGFTLQFTATGLFSDNTIEDLTHQVVWSSSNTNRATISTTGLATGVSAGTTQIIATHGSVVGSTTLTVIAADLVSIQIEPISPNLLPKGRSQQFIAIGTFSDETTKDLTTAVTWTSSNNAIVEISSAAGSEGLATGVGVGTATIIAALDNVEGTRDLQVTNAVLESIQVTPINPTRPAGVSQQFIATGNYSDNTMEDLTTQVTWFSSIPAIAIISNDPESEGLAQCLSPGVTTITATLPGVVEISGSTLLTVTPAILTEIQVSTTDPSVPKGRTSQFTAIGIYSDNSNLDLTDQVTWESDDTSVAVISDAEGSKGLATALDAGEAIITAFFDGIEGAALFTVTNAVLESITVSPFNASVPLGGPSVQFIAMGTYSDGSMQDLTTQVEWESSATNIAEISNQQGTQGQAFGKSVGTTIITANLLGIDGSATFSITPATLDSIVVTPNPESVAKGFEVQYTATANYSDGTTENVTNSAEWSSSDTNVAQISNASGSQGKATTLNTGNTTITATFGGLSGSASLTVTAATLSSIAVTPISTSVQEGLTTQFTATGTYSDSSTQDLTTVVTWKSNNEDIATISNVPGSQGQATGESVGTGVTISAALGAITGTATLDVTNATLQSITITPANPTITAGSPTQLTATGTFSSGPPQNITTEVEWSSANPAIAAVDNAPGSQGKVTGLLGGQTTTITATDIATGISDSTLVQVSCPVISITTPSLPDAFIFLPYSVQLQTSGGVAPVIFELVSGTLPDGITLSTTGLIEGNPDDLNNRIVSIIVKATSSCGSFTTRNYQFRYRATP